ncbi:MAG: asparaginase domain-containing protein [Synergistaceae bacterium]|nr:asparaginase domain-containing protein [Synergistaceae bacterium]
MPNRGKVALLISGGRIVNKISNAPGDDYIPLTSEEIFSLLREDQRENVYQIDWSRQPAGHYSLRMISDFLQLAGKQIVDGADGVVIACGSQGLEEIALFADLIWSFPQPLIFVASTQFHSPEAGARLLQQAIQAANSKSCWGRRVLVLCDSTLLSASDVVEVSNYRCAGFETPNCGIIADFEGNELEILCSRERKRVLPMDTQPVRRVEIVYASLGGGEILLSALKSKGKNEIDGLVLAAFGDGEVAPSWIPYIKKFLKEEVPILLTSRCINGRVIPGYNFEGSAYRLIEMGVLNGGGLNPLQARIKMSLGLGAGLKGEDLQTYILEDSF